MAKPSKPAGAPLVADPVLRLLPGTVKTLGGIPEALIWSQVAFLTGASNATAKPKKSVRLSYTKLHGMMPFLSRRTLIAAVAHLSSETVGALHVERDGGVNRFSTVAAAVVADTDDLPYLLVQPRVAAMRVKAGSGKAAELGVNGALVLQAVHFRSLDGAGTRFTLADWRAQCFPFWSEDTIARAFAKLVKLGLLRVGKVRVYVGDGEDMRLGPSAVNSYRVDHARLAELFPDDEGPAVPAAVVKAADAVIAKAQAVPADFAIDFPG